jgi:hypothetical protein
VSLALFLIDPVVTLARRTWQGHPIGVAHRDHAYQRLIAPGASHARVVSALVATAAGLSLVAAAAFAYPAGRWCAIAAAVGVFALEWRMAARRGAGTHERDRPSVSA